MTVTLETLFTHPACFGVTTATPVQLAFCRVADGLPLAELEEDENVVRALGGPAALDALRVTEGRREIPRELYLIGAIRGGKSMLCAAIALRAALTVDLSAEGVGITTPRVSIVSLDLDKAHVVLEHLLGVLLKPEWKPYLAEPPKAHSAIIRRHDGRVIEIKVIAGRRAGGSLLSRWNAAVIFDEATRMQGNDQAVINFDQSRRAVLGRLLPGAQLVAVGSPWAPEGPMYDAVQTSWGKPCVHLVVIRANGPELNPVKWTPEECEKLRLQDEATYRTDVLGEFADTDAAFFTDAEVRKAMREEPLDMPFELGVEYAAAIDPATSGNAWTLVLMGKRQSDTGNDADDRYFVALARQWQGSKLRPLSAAETFGEILRELQAYRMSEVWTDQWAAPLMREIGGAAGLTVNVNDQTNVERSKSYLDLRERLVSGRLELAPDKVLRADMLAIRKVYTATGIRFDLPLTGDGRHADYAPAIALATSRLASAPSWVHAMNKGRREGFWR